MSTHQSLVLVARFERNTRGRDWVVGDIHGAFARLNTALSKIGFNPQYDRLFSVGDLVDKGPASADFMGWLKQGWFYPVRGNHDQMAVDWANPQSDMDAGYYASQGGAWNVGALPQERQAYADALGALPLAIEVETSSGLVGIVHADCHTSNWPEFVASLERPVSPKALAHSQSMAQWNRSRIEMADESGVSGIRALIAGHTLVSSSLKLGNVHVIETGGWLPTALADRGLHRPGFTFVDLESLEHVFVLSDMGENA